MHRSSPRTTRILATTALPAMLVAGCSFGASESASSSSQPAPEPSTPTIAPAKFDDLPDACEAVPEKTVKRLVRKVKDSAGDAVKSDDTSLRSGCSWTGLDGYQWRWLDVSLQRYDSDPAIGTGEKRAEEFYVKQVGLAENAEGARNLKTSNPNGIGDDATAFTFEVTKQKQDYRQQTVVARHANVVITVNYNGAGFEDADQPNAADMLKDAKEATAQALAAVG